MAKTFPTKPDFAKAPAAAFCFAMPVETLDNEPEILLKSAGVIEHEWWGRIVHDMAGMQSSADRYPLDYCHDDNQVLGYVDGLRVDAEGLKVTPHLLPGDGPQEDRAAEILRKSKAGTPYQASLDWRGAASLEWVDPGVSVEVNGQTVEGPLVIARQWRMNGAAICPHGADPNTYATFSRNGEATRVLEVSRVAPEPISPAKANPPKAMSQTETAPAPDFRQLFTKFSKVFGAERALQLVDANTSYEAALESELTESRKQFAAQLDANKKAHEEALAKAFAERDEATKQLAAVQSQIKGEPAPLTSKEDESGEQKQLSGKKPNENPFKQFVKLRDAK